MTISASAYNSQKAELALKKGKKRKKKKGSHEKSETKSSMSVEQITNNSFLMNPEDWTESEDELSFDEIQSAVNMAVRSLHKTNSDTSYASCPYYVYKIWPDRVVLKRNYSVTDKPLFVMHSYEMENGVATLGDAEEVNLGFFSTSSFPNKDVMIAVREAEIIGVDDPEFAKSLLSSEDEEPEDEEEPEGNESELDSDEDEDDDLEDADEDVKESELREDVASMKIQDFSESFDSVLDGSTKIVESKNGSFIVEGMALLGAKSKNGRTYSADTRRNAVKIFEGAKAYADHPVKGREDEPRRVMELIGIHRNVRFDEATDMLRSNLHLSPTDLVKGYIIPHAKSNPGIIGNSINASGKIANDGNVMEITRARSVDIVTEPATTNGIYESVQRKGDKEKLEGGEKEMEITKEAVMKDGKIMEELKAHFYDQFEEENKNEELLEELASLKEENATMKLKQKVKDIEEEVRSMLSESNLPEDSCEDKDLVKLLEDAPNTESRKAIITRLEKAMEAVTKGGISSRRSSGEREKDLKESGNVQLTDGLIKQAASVFSSRR